MSLTHKRLKAVLSYDPMTGVFTWLPRPQYPRFQKLFAGKAAGWVHDRHGYLAIKIDGRQHLAHRLAWFYVHGKWPSEDIDHRDGCTSNNRMDNLREATVSRNLANSKRPVNNTTGFKGVVRHGREAWQASLRVRKKRLHLGTFKSPTAAHAAYVAAARVHFGEFANGGDR